MLPRLPSGIVLTLLLVSWTAVQAEESPNPAPPNKPKRQAPKENTPTSSDRPGPIGGLRKDGIKKYDDVITKDAQTMPGVFAVHRIEDKLYFEIPQSAFDRLMLWQAEVAKGQAGVSWGGMSLGSHVLRWERRGNKVYLWNVAFDKRAEGHAVQSAVESANQDTVIASFPVEAEGKDRSTVISVTPLFTGNVADLPVKRAFGQGAGAVDVARSYLSEVKAFPTNIEIRSLLTATGPHSSSALVHYSLVMLPEKPVQGRFVDPRVGYFTESFEKYDDPKSWKVDHEFITRFHLVKKDPNATVSEPVKPIVFYLSREVPEKWRSYLKKGVEDWKPAFEAAGFKDAISCREAPERAEDPTWDPEDARYSVIRWVAVPTANAMGPHVHDPRSGEIISAHIIFWHDVVRLAEMWYFMQCSAVDPKARHLPLPEELTGELLRYIACHEVGHTLGLRHNHRASQAYTVKQLRDPKFTEKHGSVASIMSYGRFNYVAQPEDGVTHLLPIVGPYDIFAIAWGYKPIPEAHSPEEERPTLDEWAARQIKEPFLRFGGEDGPAQVDPSVLTQNIGSDPVQATTLGLKNLTRVMDYLVAATTTKGEDFSLLEEAYKAILAHRGFWFGAVIKEVGGVIENRTLAGRGDEAFTRVPKEKQKEAVQFLLDNAFTTPTRLLDPAILSRFRYSAVAGDIQSQQRSLLQSLLSEGRLERLTDAELLAPDKAYTAIELVKDVQDGLWSELQAEQPKIDPLRRSLQEAYLTILKKEFEPATSAAPATPSPRRRGGESNLDAEARASELRAVARVTLRDLAKRIEAALPQVQDAATKAHLEDSLSQIESALETKKK